MKSNICIWIQRLLTIVAALSLQPSAFANPASDLAGEWQSDCVGGSWLETRSFQSDLRFTATFSQYPSGTGCLTPVVLTTNSGLYIIEDELPRGERQLNFVLSHTSILVQDADLAAHYNEIRNCGLRDWQVGVERDVTGLGCCERNGMPFLGKIMYSRYILDSNGLMFGAYGRDGMTPESRFDRLDVDRVYVKP